MITFSYAILQEFLSTPSARRATIMQFAVLPGAGISIPALREEGDTIVQQQGGWGKLFLSTPSARRATVSNATDVTIQMPFLSTPSARRATRHDGRSLHR